MKIRERPPLHTSKPIHNNITALRADIMVSKLPTLPNDTNKVKAALEIQQFLQHHLEERKNSGLEVFEIRIGMHMRWLWINSNAYFGGDSCKT